jgi:periplasmic divalent cation tolerance protein
MDVISVYITAGSAEEAAHIGRTLVEERLAACANLIPGVRSVYRWQGRVEEAEEVVVIAKTRAALFDRLARRARTLHSYECPCILALPIAAGSPDYLAWIAAETEGQP